ncbi:DUF4124 domain-containing protein [Ottowia sp.]|uniref:DUF4124 domain-containing protein n=2 Tax=Ottowia sp. TaxID=1898956 RepID=UPI002BD6B4D5|nr:DUF4124 domain-containing protein [Ottowia sp.]HOB66109.1 DUF4124 domain-containing protein [Ottowia sp.]HQD48431.1 DUF4124 domain-containing protein [Ottowia sp.]
MTALAPRRRWPAAWPCGGPRRAAADTLARGAAGRQAGWQSGRMLLLGALALCGAAAVAQTAQGSIGGIYTCVDAQGRRLTSDRPILSCIDREQRELNRGGGTRRVIPPTLSATEREARAAQEREAELAQQRARDAIYRDQALITRYPDKAAHDAGRHQALAQTQAVAAVAEQRRAELAAERKALDDEMEFYRKDPSKAPAKLRRGIEHNAQAAAEQQRAIAAQQAERDRINARFDEEARRLQPLWQGKPPTQAKR